MERLHHLCIKTPPLPQDARPHGATHRAGCPRMKKEAAKRSRGRKKALPTPPRQDRAPPAAVAHGYQDRALPPRQAPVIMAGCRAFTPELRSVVWPDKFKPKLPMRYDGTPEPAEFLQ